MRRNGHGAPVWLHVNEIQAFHKLPQGAQLFAEHAAIKAAVETAKSAGAARNWTPPRTPWGDPDLQGYYFNHSGYTPLERPSELANKPLSFGE